MTKNFSSFLAEALSPSQKKTVDDWTADRPIVAKNLSEHVFGGKDVLIHPLSRDTNNTPIHPVVQAHLHQHGYMIPSGKDYHAGYAVDKHNRIVTIGKALSRTKASPEISSAFENDPNRASKGGDLSVAYTWHPHHVAAMSTDRGWTSCMDMSGGGNKGYLEHDVANGTHVAYLIHSDDHKIERPLARIALKPFSSIDGHVALIPEHKTYGTASTAFSDAVNDFTDTHFPMKKNTHYQIHSSLYQDSITGTSDYDDRTIHSKVHDAVNGGTGSHFIRRELTSPKNIHTAIDALLDVKPENVKSPGNIIADKTYVAKDLINKAQETPISPDHIHKVVEAVERGELDGKRMAHSLSVIGNRMHPHTAAKVVDLAIKHEEPLATDAGSVIYNTGVTGSHLLKAANAGSVSIHGLPSDKYTKESIARIHADISKTKPDILSGSNSLHSKYMPMAVVHKIADNIMMSPESQYNMVSMTKRLGGNVSGKRNPNYSIEDARELDAKVQRMDDGNHYGLSLMHPHATVEDFDRHHDQKTGSIFSGTFRAIKSVPVLNHLFSSQKHQTDLLNSLYSHGVNPHTEHHHTMMAVCGLPAGQKNVSEMLANADPRLIFSPKHVENAKKNMGYAASTLANGDDYHDSIRKAVKNAVDDHDPTFASKLMAVTHNRVAFPKEHLDYVRKELNHSFNDTPVYKE